MKVLDEAICLRVVGGGHGVVRAQELHEMGPQRRRELPALVGNQM